MAEKLLHNPGVGGAHKTRCKGMTQSMRSDFTAERAKRGAFDNTLDLPGGDMLVGDKGVKSKPDAQRNRKDPDPGVNA